MKGWAAEAYHHHQQHHHLPDFPFAPAPCSLRTVPHAWLKGTWTLRDDSGRSHGHLMLLFPITMEEVGVYEEIYGASGEETSSSTVCSCPALCNVSFPLSFTEMLGYRWAYSCRVYRSKIICFVPLHWCRYERQSKAISELLLLVWVQLEKAEKMLHFPWCNLILSFIECLSWSTWMLLKFAQ